MVCLAVISATMVLAPLPDMEEFLARHDLIWEKAPGRWLDGIPLANGDIGALVWGDGGPLKLTLDKYDAWETREKSPYPADVTYAELRKWVAAGDAKKAEQCLYTEHIYGSGPQPTRLPMPRLELDFGKAIEWKSARLRLHMALTDIAARVDGQDVLIGAFVNADRNVLVVMLEGKPAAQATVRLTLDHLNQDARNTLKNWGYPDPEISATDTTGSLRIKAPSGLEYAAAWTRTTREDGNVHIICLALLSNNDAADPLAEARKLAAEAAKPEDLTEAHRRWWADYWQRSFVTIPDARLESLYYAEMYKLGCCARPGKLPITLQGLWTLDGGMPPWAGEYPLDMNVQQSYWPIYAANRLDLGEGLYETFFKCLPRWQRQCKDFFGFDGAWSGCAIGPQGQRVFGYSTVELWPGSTAWLAHHYWLHFLYSQDTRFLKDRALPMLRACFLTYANLLENGPDGKLHVPLSYSPEWGEGSIGGYGQDPACDIALIRFLSKALLRSAEILGKADPLADRARDVLANLTDLPQSGNHLLVRAGVPLSHSHRHHSHLMAIHPLEELTLDDGDKAVALIRNSLHDIRVQGVGQWTGWAFPWMSLIASRAGYPNMAFQMLDLYVNAFITPNTFHINGDPKNYGICLFTYEPMTLEAGFGAAAAIMEMLLQSWHETIRVFPTTPDFWPDAYFCDLRAQGAFLVSAKRIGGKTRFVQITSEAGRPCKLKNPFSPQSAQIVEMGPQASAAASARALLSGEMLTFPTVKGRTYMLYPENNPLSSDDPAASRLKRDKAQANYFGLKKLPRF